MQKLDGLAAYHWALGVERRVRCQVREDSGAQRYRAVLDNPQPKLHTGSMTLIRRATNHDAARLSELAATTFRDTFEAENSADDLEAYVAEAFTPERQTSEISDLASIVLLAEHDSGAGPSDLIGYAHLVAGAAPPSVRGPSPVELKRLYVSHAWHGKGVARDLMNAVLVAARTWGAQTLWLGVWERNARAVAFYEKYGFTRVGEHTFLLGADRQTDWLLEKPLGDPST